MTPDNTIKEKFKLSATCSLYLVKENKVLMLLRSNTGFLDGHYGLVAGKLEDGETFREAMVREAKEEANLDLLLGDLEIAHVMHRNQYFKDGYRERIDMYFTTDKWDGEIKNMEPEKHGSVEWFDLSSMPLNTIPYNIQAIECILNNKLYSEIGFEH